MSYRPPGLWMLVMVVGLVCWFAPGRRSLGLLLLWPTLAIALVCGASAAFLPKYSGATLLVACGILFILCYAIAVSHTMDLFDYLRGVRDGAEDVYPSLVAGLGLVLLPSVATIGTVVGDAASSTATRGIRLGVLIIVLAPISGIVTMLLGALVFPNRL